jgi:hypothetical protein
MAEGESSGDRIGEMLSSILPIPPDHEAAGEVENMRPGTVIRNRSAEGEEAGTVGEDVPLMDSTSAAFGVTPASFGAAEPDTAAAELEPALSGPPPAAEGALEVPASTFEGPDMEGALDPGAASAGPFGGRGGTPSLGPCGFSASGPSCRGGDASIAASPGRLGGGGPLYPGPNAGEAGRSGPGEGNAPAGADCECNGRATKLPPLSNRRGSSSSSCG